MNYEVLKACSTAIGIETGPRRPAAGFVTDGRASTELQTDRMSKNGTSLSSWGGIGGEVERLK